MALTKTDLQQIREVVIEGVLITTWPPFESLELDIIQIKIIATDLKLALKKMGAHFGSIRREYEAACGRLIAIENDVKETYSMILGVMRSRTTNELFSKTKLEEKIHEFHDEILVLAKEADITLQQ